MIKVAVPLLAMCLVGYLSAGCDKVGQTPAGGSDAEVKSYFDSQPLDVRAKQIMGSPAPMDFKVKRIKEMYAKEGKTPPPEVLSQQTSVGR